MPHANKDMRNAYQAEWIASRRRAYLADKSCVRCGAADRLEIDHVDRATKVTHRIWSWSEARRIAELAKCQVLCHDCHLKKTKLEVLPSHGSASRYRRGCRCDDCKNAQTVRMRAYRARKQAFKNMEEVAA